MFIIAKNHFSTALLLQIQPLVYIKVDSCYYYNTIL